MAENTSKKEKKKEKTPQKLRRRFSMRGKQQRTSIFFLLWTAFAALSVFVILFMGFMQRSQLVHSYKDEVSREVSERGAKVHEFVLVGPTSSFVNNNYNGYIRFLSDVYDVDILILSEGGTLVYPNDPNLNPDSPEYQEHYHYEKETKVLKEELEKQGTKSVVYEGDSEYVYGAEIVLYGQTPMYLRVSQSLNLMQSAISGMNVRTVMLAVFAITLTFAISSAVAGWLVNPITELTKKARKLAEGNFDVDFHGNDYGRELVELADSLNFARDELSKTDRMQKELIANVSHDFKTPLTMIKGYASMIMEISGENPEKRNKHAKIIVDETDRLTSLVNDVLDLSKIRSGITQLEKTEFDMGDYLYSVLEKFAYLKDTQDYQFIVEIEDELYVTADKLKIGQVLYNLIGNAVNYTGEDKRVYVSLKKEGEGYCRFSVKDTGSGIKAEELPKIWERYYRSSEMHKRPVKGSGLGLSIVRTILERHGFLFGVDSVIGEGSTFYVLFPCNTLERVDKEGK